MTTRLKIILASLAGAGAIQLALFACATADNAGGKGGKSAGGGTSNNGVPDAMAAPTDCSAWEVKAISIGALDKVQQTGAWEPIGGGDQTGVILRRCAN